MAQSIGDGNNDEALIRQYPFESKSNSDIEMDAIYVFDCGANRVGITMVHKMHKFKLFQ
jgi:hypothetical protein